MIRSLRDEALLLLEGRGAILSTAREVTEALAASGFDCAVVGGVATVLHGHVRSTSDVDVFLAERDEGVREALERAGFEFDEEQREFRKGPVPVHLVFPEQLSTVPTHFVQISGVRCVDLPDLVTMKLELGTTDPLRAQDIADVIGLIRANRLTGEFAAKIAKSVRSEFRKLAKAIAQRDSNP